MLRCYAGAANPACFAHCEQLYPGNQVSAGPFNGASRGVGRRKCKLPTYQSATLPLLVYRANNLGVIHVMLSHPVFPSNGPCATISMLLPKLLSYSLLYSKF